MDNANGLVCGAWASAVLCLTACGGDASVVTPHAPAAATLAVNLTALALAAQQPGALPVPIPGTPRMLTVTNTGTEPALAVAVDPTVALPAGTTVSGACGTLAPMASCTFTITPGAVATTAPLALPILGGNTNRVEPVVAVLAYGSVYQGGYVFAIDDTTPPTGSVGGKVAAMSDTAPPVIWSPDGDVLPGTDELALAPCEGAVDGVCNTRVIVAHYTTLLGVDPGTYLAGQCDASSAGGYTDWYLPAICEAGYAAGGWASGCGTALAPRLQNMQLNLVNAAGVGGLTGLYRTSTTVSAGFGFVDACWLQDHAPGPGAQAPTTRVVNAAVGRCVRALTP